MDFLMMRWAEFLQTVADGFCSVFFAGYVAPRRARAVRIVAATMTIIFYVSLLIAFVLTNFFQGTPKLEVSWHIVLYITTFITVIATALIRDTPPAHALPRGGAVP